MMLTAVSFQEVALRSWQRFFLRSRGFRLRVMLTA